MFLKRIFLSIVLFLALSVFSFAQKWSVSTNTLDYANFGTLNVEGSVAVSRYFTVDLGLKFNPWIFGKSSVPELQKYNKQRSVYVSARYFPWFVYDGWYFGALLGWREYAVAGIFSGRAEEGDAFGGGLGVGYSYLLHKNLNLDFGAYCWAGSRTYNVYSCPSCGRPLDSGTKGFILPTNIRVALTWVFGQERKKKSE